MKNLKGLWKYFIENETGIAIIVSSLVLFVSIIFGIVNKIYRQKKERRKRLLEEEKQLVFTLPDRENQFIRERLNGPLRVYNEFEKKRNLDLMDMNVNFSHMRNLLIKIRQAPLSASEKLQIDEISTRITDFILKNVLTQEEFSELNEKLVVILKIAAKYAV